MRPFYVLLISFFLLTSCSDNRLKEQLISGQTMGTTYNIKFLTNEHSPTDIKTEVDKRLLNLNLVMSTYIPISEISKFNSSNSLEAYPVGKELYTVTEYAVGLAQRSGGAYDPTIGPLVNLWGFGPNGEREVPEDKKLEELKALVGYEKLELSQKGDQYYFQKSVPGLYLDLSSTAKGFGVDVVAELLESKGISNYMVEIGGEIKVGGLNNKNPWRIGVESPDGSESGKPILKVLKLYEGQAVATSGDYRNFFESDGIKYSHTINPRTGKPVDGLMISVTVVEKDSTMIADALATALNVMGPAKAIDFANKYNLNVYLVYKEKIGDKKTQTFASQEFSKMFK